MGLTTIMTGIDPSPLASEALTWASDLADTTKSRLRVVGTWQMPLIGVLRPPIAGLPTEAFMADQCATMIQSVVDEAGTEPDQVMCLEGKPGPTLLDASTGADLLVVGRTGQGKRRGLARFAEVVLGSTARHCLHHSAIPVAAVPTGVRWPKHNATVLVGVDGSSNSLEALDWALASLPADTNVHVVRAFTPWVGDGLTPLDLVTDTTLLRAFEVETSDWVRAAVQRVNPQLTQDPVVTVSIGGAIEVLLGSQTNPDLIVVGERGHTGVAAMVLGSVADHLVRYAPCPVVVVPTPDRTTR